MGIQVKRPSHKLLQIIKSIHKSPETSLKFIDKTHEQKGLFKRLAEENLTSPIVQNKSYLEDPF